MWGSSPSSSILTSIVIEIGEPHSAGGALPVIYSSVSGQGIESDGSTKLSGCLSLPARFSPPPGWGIELAVVEGRTMLAAGARQAIASQL
nr:hypothetical protein Iba_chr07cCG3170 [Ipomoea batatas]